MTSSPGNLLAAVMPVDITPPIGTRLDGYGARKGPSNDVHDPLFATLLALKSGSSGVAMLSLDLVAVKLGFTNRIRRALSPILGIPEDCILVAAIHTHSGPAGFLGRLTMPGSTEDPFLEETILRRLAGGAGWVAQHLGPAQLSVGRGEVRDLGRNRNDPVNGPVDYDVNVLRVDGEEGQSLAVLMNYGCHPTVLGPENLAISADYPGAARAALNKIYPKTTFFFFNGATGDVSTRFTRRGQGFDEVERMGRILAGEVLKVMQVATPVDAPELIGQIQPLTLPFRQFPSADAAQRQLEAFEADLARQRAAGLPHGEIRKAVTRVEGAQAQLHMAQSLGGAVSIETQVQALRLGPVALFSVPGEPFTQIVLDIKAKSPAQSTLAVSYGNDYCGYFPDRPSIIAGTYEALTSPFDETAGEMLKQAAITLLG